MKDMDGIEHNTVGMSRRFLRTDASSSRSSGSPSPRRAISWAPSLPAATLPSSMVRAISTSSSALSNGTRPISLRYVWTGSSALPPDSPEDERFPLVSVLHLSDGTRVVCLSESGDGRISRLLRRFSETYRLTPAERAALLDIAHGSSAKESAQRLSLSPETVRARRKRIFRKMGVDGCGAVLARFLQDA